VVVAAAAVGASVTGRLVAVFYEECSVSAPD
jgi:hypothetical protein